MSGTDESGTDDPGALLDDHVQAGRWSEVVSILDRHWGEVLSANPRAVQRAVNALPQDVLSANPRWALATNYVNRFVTNGQTPTTIFRGTEPTPEPSSLLDVLARLTSRVAAKRAGGRYAEAVEFAREARALLDDADDDTRSGLTQALPEIIFQWAMAWEYYGDTDTATREYIESFDAAVAIGHRLAEASAAGATAWMHSLAGRNIQARSWLDRLPPSDGDWWDNRASIAARFAHAQLLIDELALDRAREELSRVSLTGVPERWPAQKYLLAQTAQDAAECADLLTQIDSSAIAAPLGEDRQGAWEPYIAITRAMLLARLENWAAARAALDDVGPDHSRTDIGGIQSQLWKAAARLQAGDVTRARRDATALIEVSTAAPRVLIGALAIAGAAAHRLGDREAAVRQLTMAFSLAEKHRLYKPITLVPSSDLSDVFELIPDLLPEEIRDALVAESGRSDTDPFLELSPRELAVVRSITAHDGLDEVAAGLFVSRNTVKSQLRSIYRKLGIRSRPALEELALRHGYTNATSPRRDT